MSEELQPGMTRIVNAPEVFTLINTFTVPTEYQQNLIDLLVDITERVTHHLPGFLSATVHRGEDNTHVANYVQWKTRADFMSALKHPEMQKHIADIRRYTTEVLPLTYIIAYSRSTSDETAQQ